MVAYFLLIKDSGKGDSTGNKPHTRNNNINQAFTDKLIVLILILGLAKMLNKSNNELKKANHCTSNTNINR